MLSPSTRYVALALSSIVIPHSVSEAQSQPKWKAAMEEEMQALEKNGTLDIVDVPIDKDPVRCKWVFTVKLRPDGSVDRYKVRLVAKGYTQTYGVDY